MEGKEGKRKREEGRGGEGKGETEERQGETDVRMETEQRIGQGDT